MSSDSYHEPVDRLSEEVMDRHRGIQSIMEELEAVDWYDQRVSATDDEELAAVLAHNRDEEKEHAAMGIEWLRRRDEYFDSQLRTYLFTDAPITEVEHEAESDGGHGDDSPQEPDPREGPSDGSLGIGSLREPQPDPTLPEIPTEESS
jgi:ferritin-like protein